MRDYSYKVWQDLGTRERVQGQYRLAQGKPNSKESGKWPR